MRRCARFDCGEGKEVVDFGGVVYGAPVYSVLFCYWVVMVVPFFVIFGHIKAYAISDAAVALIGVER